MTGETAVLQASFERCFERGPTIRAELDCALGAFSVTALIGASGSGKTTVLRCLAGLDTPQAGQIVCGTEAWFDQARRVSLPPQRRGIGYLFQEYALFPHLPVYENIAFGLRHASSLQKRERVAELLAALQIGDLGSRYPHELSGGQQQRVALARTVASRPRLLLLDEPLAALDTPTRSDLRRQLRGLLESWQIPVIIVTHDAAEVRALAHRVIVLCDGQVRQRGTVDEVMARPADAQVARLLGLSEYRL